MNQFEIERFVLREMKTRDWFYGNTVWGEIKSRLGKPVSFRPILKALNRLEDSGAVASWRQPDATRYYRTMDEREGRAILARHRRAEEIFLNRSEVSFDDQTLRDAVQLLMDGETLASRMESGTLTIEEITGIAIGLAFELRYAHNFGVRHGNIDAENIMVCPNGQIRLLRFEDGTSQDMRCDIIAVGWLLNEMVSGRRATPASEALRRIAQRAAHPDGDIRHPSAEAVQKDLNRLYPDSTATAKQIRTAVKGILFEILLFIGIYLACALVNFISHAIAGLP